MSDNKAETELIRSVKNYNLILMTSRETLRKVRRGSFSLVKLGNANVG